MKATIISIVISITLVGSVLFFMNNKSSQNNVSIVDGKQIIEISAKGGYSPKLTTAKAGLPTILKMKTQSTFDCSSSLFIPALNYRTNLIPSGTTDIEVSPQKSGTTLQGLCAMGMFGFKVKFN